MTYGAVALILILCLGHWAGLAARPAEAAASGSSARSDPDSSEAEVPETGSAEDPGPPPGTDFTAFPFAFSTPETGLAGGAGIILVHRGEDTDPADRPETVSLFFVYTEKQQISLSLSPEVDFVGREWRLRTSIEYAKYPTSFYGIGDETPADAEEDYTYEGGSVQGTIMRRALGSLHAGLVIEAKGRSISGETTGGLIDRGEVDGAGGGFYSGLGPGIEWDGRNRIFFPTRGSWMRFWIVSHGRGTGSDATYGAWTADIRRYGPLTASHVFAIQALASGRTGTPPFHELAQIGAYERGIVQGRLTDRAMALVQIEDRFPVWRRLAGAVFVAAGDVCDGLARYRLAGTKVAAGGGLRFVMDKRERIHLRADLGLSRYGGEVYFQFLEAF